MRRRCSLCRLPGHDRRAHRRNPAGAGYKVGGVFHPIRKWAGYDPARVGEGKRKVPAVPPPGTPGRSGTGRGTPPPAAKRERRPKEGTSLERSWKARELRHERARRRLPIFEDYDAAVAYAQRRIAENRGRPGFGASPEWHVLHAELRRLRKEARKPSAEYREAAAKALREAGLRHGDRVTYAVAGMFGGGEILEGRLTERGGVPMVHLDRPHAVEGKGVRRYVNWHRGWRKA